MWTEEVFQHMFKIRHFALFFYLGALIVNVWSKSIPNSTVTSKIQGK